MHPVSSESRNATPPAILGALVADDDASIRRLVAKRFAAAGFTVYEARHGAEAAELALQHRPSLVVSDWNMPKLDGIQLAKLLADELADDAPPFVLLTAREFEVSDDMLAGLNVKLVMRKPFSARKLIDASLELVLPEIERRRSA